MQWGGAQLGWGEVLFQKSKKGGEGRNGEPTGLGEGNQEEGGRRQSLLHTSVVLLLQIKSSMFHSTAIFGEGGALREVGDLIIASSADQPWCHRVR